jgi:hypothetical protein
VLRDGGDLGLPPSAIQEPFLETATFPVQYYRADLCESFVFASAWKKPFAGQATASRLAKFSVKEAFVRKLCSCGQDYSGYPLLQFQFDRYVLRINSQWSLSSVGVPCRI